MATDQPSKALEMRLRAIGSRRYHDQHPFHKDLHAGHLNKQQIQAWALNRYCYQAVIPKKDSAIMARIDDPMLRTIWRQRVIDHDGDGTNSGGINRWLKLTDSLGLDRDYVISEEGALPATQFAVSAYLHFVTENSLLEAIASSLTEMFSPRIIAERVSGMLANYDLVTEETMAYFKPRLSQAPRDVDFALAYVLEHADSIQKQDKVAAALTFKCNVLWSQLDALYGAYIEPGMIPPGSFTPTLTKPA